MNTKMETNDRILLNMAINNAEQYTAQESHQTGSEEFFKKIVKGKYKIYKQIHKETEENHKQ